ncbi:hypothetical protein [Vreelandella venusta]|uniref:hypothetical protein n=1 Tax=Vreelandella venusta TaxID=44935 RepID=UPI00116E0798|nr:hypothetical protein [Halomonas venusta]GEK52331.1 hypothetical protein HVE01_30520 [Halomonas venusta]
MSSEPCTITCGISGVGVKKPGDPEGVINISAVGVIGGVDVTWTYPEINPNAVAYTIIYRSLTGTFEDAVELKRVSANYHYDRIDAETPREYFYWVKTFSISGTSLELAGPASATPKPFISEVIKDLSDMINDSHLAQKLKEKIAKIELLELDILQERLDRIDSSFGINAAIEDARRVADDAVNLLNEYKDLQEFRFGDFVAAVNEIQLTLGTSFEQIAQEREERIAGLNNERDERIEGLLYEADARTSAIQEEAAARNQQFLNLQEQYELDQGLYASQLAAIAAAYNSNAATIYTLEEVRISDREATATRIDGLAVEVENNEAQLIEERQVRADALAALASRISVLSAKIDALPSFANSFESGVEMNRWVAGTGHTITPEIGDVFSGEQAAIIGSTVGSVATGSVPFGVAIPIPSGTGDSFIGRRLRVGLAAKAIDGGSTEFAVGYATSDGWFSGWQRHAPNSTWTVFDSEITVPDTAGVTHYVVLWGDTSGSGGTVKVDRLLVDVADTEIPEITAQLEEIQQALADTKQSLAEDITNLVSTFGETTSAIENKQTTLSNDLEGMALEIQTLTAANGDLAADIQRETEARVDLEGALSQDVTDLWAGVGKNEGRITQQAVVQATDDLIRGLIQNVITAHRDTASATIYSLEGVNVDRYQSVSMRVDGIESQLGEGLAQVKESQRTEVIRLDGAIQVNAQAITTVESKLGDDLATAQQVFDTRIKAVGDDVKANALAITNVITDTGNAISNVRQQFTTDIEEVDGRVVANANAITDTLVAIEQGFSGIRTDLTSEINRVDGRISGNTKAINESRTDILGTVAGVQEEITTEVNRLDGRINSTAAAVSTVQSELEDELSTVRQSFTTQISNVAGDVSNNAKAIIQVQTASTDGIAGVQQKLTSEIKRVDGRITGNATRINEVGVALEEGMSGLQDTIIVEVNRLDGRINSTGSRITTLQSSLEGDISSVQTKLNTQVERLDDRIGSTASQISTVQSVLGEDISSVRQTMQTNVNSINGKITGLGALYTAQVQSNGLIGGFGIYNDGTRVDAGFDVDLFWIGKHSLKKKPFIISNGDIFFNGRVQFNRVNGLGTLAGKDSIVYEDMVGSTADTVRDRANSTYGRVFDSWTRPGSTTINGNRIYTGDAYVDTLQIKGRAVTVPVSAAASSLLDITPGSKKPIIAASIDAQGANVLVSVSFGVTEGSLLGFEIRRDGIAVVGRPGGNGAMCVAAHVGGKTGTSVFSVYVWGDAKITGRSIGLIATLR